MLLKSAQGSRRQLLTIILTTAGATAGTSLLGLAKQLVLSRTNGTTSQQWTFHKAFVEAGTEIPYNQEDQSILTVPFRVVPDPDRLTDADALFKYETF